MERLFPFCFFLKSVLSKTRDKQTNIASLFFLAIFIWQGSASLEPIGEDSILMLNILLLLQNLAYIFSSVLFYLLLMHLLYAEFLLKKWHLLLFILPVGYGVFFLFQILTYPEFLVHSPLNLVPGFSIIEWGTLSLTFIFYSLSIISIIRIKPETKNKSLWRHTVIMLALVLLSVFLESTVSFSASNALVTCIFLYGYIISTLHPDLLVRAEEEGFKRKYQKSKLSGVSKTTLHQNITRLLSEEKIFKREDLSLEIMARMLKITAHQLSEFINSNYYKSFKQFINSYRVEEAKKIMEENDTITLTEIAFEVGFNSIPTFYRTFTEYYTISPGAYRKKMLCRKK